MLPAELKALHGDEVEGACSEGCRMIRMGRKKKEEVKQQEDRLPVAASEEEEVEGNAAAETNVVRLKLHE